MTDVKITIKTIDETKGGIEKVNANLEKMATAADHTAIRLAALKAKTAELGQGVASGKMNIEQAANALAQFRAGLDKSSDGLGKTSKQTEGLSTKFVEMKAKLDLVTGGLKAAGDVFAKAFAFAKEGAAINQIKESFDRMNASIFKTPDLLERMQEAARGTIGDTGLMEGVLRLTAGTSDDLARALAAAAPQLLEIAKASNKLNPALGDTAFLYESISTGIKRSSPLILDNLGIVVKVGEANEKYAAAIGKTVEQLTAEDKTMALLNATMESGNKLIEQVGGNVDAQGDSFARLEVMVQGANNAFKQWLADGLLPVAAALDSTYGKAAAATIESNIATAKSMEDLIEVGKGYNESWGVFLGLGKSITGTTDEIKTGIMDVVGQMALSAPTFEDFQAGIESAFGRQVQRSISETIRLSGMSQEEFYKLARAMSEAESADRKFFQAQQDVAESMEEVTRLTAAQSRAIVNANLENHTYEVTAEQVTEAEKKRAEAHEEAAKATEEAAERMRELKAATGDYFVAALEAEGGAGFFNEALSDLGNHSAFVSNMTAEQKSDLELLTDAYDKAADKLHNYELGIGTTGMEQESLSEKMAEQQAIMDELGPKIAQLNTVGGEYVSWTTEATINQDAVNSALFDAVDAADGSAAQLALLGGALGLYSEDAVEAALKSAAIQDAINRMAPAFVDGKLSISDMQTALADLITRLENPPPPLILETNIAEAMEGLSEADAKLAEKLGVFTEESQGMATNAQTAFGSIAGAATDNMPTFETAVDEAMANSAKSAEENMAAVQTAVGDNLSKALTIAEGYPSQFGSVGTNIGQTMTAALLAEGGALSNAAAQIVTNALAAAEAAAGIESPSKVAMWQMSQIIEGYVSQARAQGGSVADALEDMINGAFDKVGDSISAASTFQRAADFFSEMLEDGDGGGMEQQLAFLQQQAKILETIQELGLDPGAVLGGIELGLGADVQALLDAVNAALAGMIEGIDSGLGEAQDVAESGLDALAEAIRRHEEKIAAAFEAVGDSISAGKTFGNLSQSFADMLFPDNSEAVSAVEGRIADAFGGQLPDLEKNFDELMGYAQSTGQKQLIADLEEYRRLQDERNEAEKKMLEIQQKQQQLGFLQSQLDLLQMLQESGLNPADVLNGIQLGLGADIEDLLAASQAAMNAMIAQANGQLGGLSGLLGGGTMGGPGGIATMGMGGAGNALTAAMGGGLWAGPIGQPGADSLSGGGMSLRDINIYLTAPNTGNPYLFGREVANQVANRLGVRG